MSWSTKRVVASFPCSICGDLRWKTRPVMRISTARVVQMSKFYPGVYSGSRRQATSITGPGACWVMLSGVVPNSPVHLSLFDAQADPRRDALMQRMDRINGRCGRDTIHSVATGTEQPWRRRP